jgi:SWI/SNF-related matrix-associated actin-dependent regulator 1 of chromatin subfamily A
MSVVRKARAWSVAAALVVPWLLPSRAAAEACAVQCDTSCTNCCSQWAVRASCPDGTSRADGSFRTFDEAQAAADTLAACDSKDAACQSKRMSCSGGATATYAAWCDAKNKIASPKGSDATRAFDAVLSNLDASIASVDAAYEEIASFARTRLMKPAAAPRLAAATDAVRAARDALRAARFEAGRARATAVTEQDAKTSSDKVAPVLKEGADAVAGAKAVLQDPTIIDAPAEERRRQAAAAAEAAARAREAAAEAARKRKEEEAARAEAAAAARAAAIEAEKRKKEEAEALRAAAALSIAEKKVEAERKQKAVTAKLGETQTALAAELAALGALIASPSLRQEDRAKAVESQRKLRALEEQSRALRARADAGAQRPPAEALGALTRAELEAGALATGVTAAIAASRQLRESGSAGAAARQALAIPICALDFTPADGAQGVSLSMDGGKPVLLPAKINVSSGRHNLTITSGSKIERRSELLVCKRLQSVPIRAPK